MRSAILVLVLSLMIGLSVNAASHGDVADEVIALARAQWAADLARDTAKSVSFLADDYTEFNRDYPTRLDGKELNAVFYKAFNEGAPQGLVFDMENEKVQVYGDVAILTYNFVGATKNTDGVIEPNLAKSTRVYAKIEGTWKLVHANFAPVN